MTQYYIAVIPDDDEGWAFQIFSLDSKGRQLTIYTSRTIYKSSSRATLAAQEWADDNQISVQTS